MTTGQAERPAGAPPRLPTRQTAATTVSLETDESPTAASRTEPARLALPVASAEQLADHLNEYNAHVPKSILELQPFRTSDSIEIERPGGGRGRATLVNLNPDANVWYLLRLEWPDEAKEHTYHLENRDHRGRELILARHYQDGLIVGESGRLIECPLWSADAPLELEAAANLDRPYVSLCGGAFDLRNPTVGHRTTKESVAEFLRDNVWLGEELTDFVKTRFFADAYLEEPGRFEVHAHAEDGVTAAVGPAPAPVHCDGTDECLKATEIGIRTADASKGGVTIGRWHRAAAGPGIYLAAIQPGLVPSGTLSHPERVDALDEVEAHALAYLVAFDLEQFDLRFALGTEHPRVDWSKRAPQQVRDPRLPGPDGVSTISPLIATGMIAPDLRRVVAASFTAGFKREHGAFKWSRLSTINSGSHYGFIENGVVFSKLQPNLATLLVFADGSVEMKTWSKEDDVRLPGILFARQNGVPIIERDPTTGHGVPGPFVNQWGPGNWSGSQDRRLRALRAGLCLHERNERQFLIYGYFSSATPSAMARVFQAYNCSYAMHLDMNALEHTYLAIYETDGGGVRTEHLVDGMEVLDKHLDDVEVPRFVGYADNRDFFYLLRRPRAGQESAG